MMAPIIVSEHGELIFFRSVALAERYLEPIDVENDEYVAYDGSGQRLALKVVDTKIKMLYGLWTATKKSVVILDEGKRKDRGELYRIVVDYLRRVGADPGSFEGAELGALIERAVEHAGFSD